MLQFRQSAGPVAVLRAGSGQLGWRAGLVFALLNISIIYMLVCLLLSWAGRGKAGWGVHVCTCDTSGRAEAAGGERVGRDNT